MVHGLAALHRDGLGLVLAWEGLVVETQVESPYETFYNHLLFWGAPKHTRSSKAQPRLPLTSKPPEPLPDIPKTERSTT